MIIDRMKAARICVSSFQLRSRTVLELPFIQCQLSVCFRLHGGENVLLGRGEGSS